MRILHISKYYYPFIGGIEQVARDCVNALSEHNEQKVICFNHNSGTTHDVVDDVEIIRIACQAKIASQSISFTYGKELKSIIKSFLPDVVIFHYPNPFAAHFILKLVKKYNFKLVTYWHLDITKQKILGKLFHRQNIKIINNSFKVIGATPVHISASKYEKLLKLKSVIIPFAIDSKRLQVTDETLAKAAEIRKKYGDKKICFFIGRHVPYKGLTYLIDAAKYLPSDYQILIAGQGDLTEQLKQQAKENKNIEFLGKIDNLWHAAYLYACDIFCFPSITKNEAFGLAMAEAMYFSKPVVTFTIPGSGVNYVNLNNITGLEVPNSDSKEYANAIIKLGKDEQLRLKFGSQAHNRVIENFTVEKFSQRLNDLLLEIHNN